MGKSMKLKDTPNEVTSGCLDGTGFYKMVWYLLKSFCILNTISTLYILLYCMYTRLSGLVKEERMVMKSQ